jgi:uncharacterized hydantoinase/oxoprolinase family protein
MFQQIKELVQDARLQQTLKSAATQAEAVGLLLTASAERGYKFTAEGIEKVLSTLASGKAQELGEEELLAVSGGLKCCESAGGSGSSSGGSWVGMC